MKNILLGIMCVLCCGIAEAQLLYSTKFESQPVGTAYTRPVWTSDGFVTGSWDGFLDKRTVIDDTYSYSGEKSLRVSYPKGCYGNSTNGTGAQVDLKFDARDEAYMSYWIRFSDDFSWGTTSEGGKLPGLGSGNTSGDKVSDGTNGFTARFMWRTGGRLVVLLYHMDFTSTMGEDVELFYPDGSPVIATRGEWHHIVERVKTNSVSGGKANPDGELQVWFDGQQVLLRKGLRFRVNNDGIDELYFSTFHGGGDASWAPTVDSYIWFDDIRIGTTYESVAMQTCQNPNLGNDKALCGAKSINIEANYSNAQVPYLAWYKDGKKINSKTNQITAQSAGLYAAYYDSAWCAQKSSITVHDNIKVDLGEDQYICSSSFATLESNITGDSYVWKKDGATLTETTKSIRVKDAGTYSLTVKQTGCSDASDNVKITSGALTFADYSGDAGSTVTIASPTGGNIHWYENPSSSPVATGKAYNATLSAGETYIYASDADKFEGVVGKPAVVTGQTWHKNDYTMKLKFTVYKELTIDEITVYPYASQNITINIVNASNSTKVFTKTFTGVQGGEATLDLNATLPAGTYYMDGDGSTGELLMSHNGDTEIAFPYTIEDLISITGSYYWNKEQTGYYMYFYNFKVSTGNTCAAAPIKLTGNRNGDYPISTNFESQTVDEPLNRTKWENEGFIYAWGSDASFPVRSKIVDEVSVSGNNSLKITYPKGEVGPSGGGAQALFKIPNRSEIYSSYYVRFSEDFSWGGTNKEGKLPGICGMGGWDVCDGGKACDGTNGFSARPIWYGDGNLMLYLYDMDKTGVYGVNYPLKDAEGNQIVIKKGEWIHIAERVKINTVTNGVANPDGEVEFWINGVPALSISGYRFITTDDQINVFYFDTFMGGSGSTYAPANTCYTWFDDMIISDVYDDVKFKGQIAPQTYTVTFVDWDNTVLSTQTIEMGKNAVAPTEPSRTGYTFAGWKGDFTNVSANVTIVATYTENTPVIPDADVTVVIDAEKDNIAISPYMYSMNSMMQYADRQKLAKDAGIRMSRQNMGNNSTLYNWRRKLTVHPDWYNNVYAEDWDTTAQSMAKNFSDIQGMFGFQLIGRAAATTEYNFPDWQYNKSVRWDGCGKNLCGNGSSVGNYNTTDDGDVNLYTEKWTPDSTTAIIPHWKNDLKLDLNQFQYWNMDNEAEIWAGTHDAVFPNPTSEMLETYLQNYFETVKLARKLYPNIKICGPVAAHEWSWYFPSGAGQPIYNGKKYNWLEYFIMRCAQEEKASGVKMIDVFDIHNYPEVTGVEDILQTHRMYWDTEYDYPGANGVKGVKGNWDNSVTKEMVLVRCQEWFDTYFGPNYDVTYGTSEYNVKTNVPMLTALAYAGNLGEGARHGMEFFIPWDWRVGMWETVHLFSRYAKNLNVSAVSSDEAMISAYTSVNTDRDSLTIIFVNRNASGTQSVATSISNFTCPDGEYDALQLSDLPATETFVSHTNNALKSKQVSIKDGVFSIELPAYSMTAVVLSIPDIEDEEFTVSFVVDEKVVSEQTVLKGEDAEVPDDPTKIGYDFVEWDKDFTNVTEDLTISAVFEKHQYTVLFKDWDGTKIEEQKVAFGDDAVAPADPTRENYEFVGWSGTFTNISEDITITATYIEIGKADYSALNEAIAKAEALETISYTKATVDALNSALKAAKSVDTDLYVTDQSVVDDATAALISAMNDLKVQTFVVTFIADGKIVSEQTVEYGQSAKMPDNPTKEGYDFVEWNVDYSSVTEELSITAVFEKHLFIVRFEDWDGTKIEEQKVAFGDDAVAPKDPTRENYEFAGWSGTYTNISVDVTIIATYTEIGKAKYTALDNAIAEAELLTDEKYSEATWNALQTALTDAKQVERDLMEESQPIIDNATKNLTDALKNLSVKTFTVVFTSDGKTVSTQTISYGESAEMPEKPQKEGYKFIKWDIDYSVVTSDMTITAVYEVLTFTVIFKDYNGTELSKQVINYGEAAIAPTAPTRDGYTFVSWDANFSNVTVDMIITATYKEKTKASYTALDKTIASTTSLQEAKYSTSSWAALQSALLEAKNIDRNLYSDSQAIVDAANKALQEAINGLVQIDKTKLASTIDKAQSTITSADGNIGDEIGQYPQSAVAALQSVIATSQQVYANAQTQTELDNQTTTLNEAIQTFLQSKNKRIVDVSTLSALVLQANDLLHNNTAGDRPGQYGLIEFMDLYVARDGGESLLQQAEPATENIYAQVTRLEIAIEAFLNSYIPLAIDDVETDCMVVYAVNHSIFVKNAEGVEITIYDNSGRKVSQTSAVDVTSEKEYFIETIGVYHVFVGNTSYSVVVK